MLLRTRTLVSRSCRVMRVLMCQSLFEENACYLACPIMLLSICRVRLLIGEPTIGRSLTQPA
jgi:hypothetical protein